MCLHVSPDLLHEGRDILFDHALIRRITFHAMAVVFDVSLIPTSKLGRFNSVVIEHEIQTRGKG